MNATLIRLLAGISITVCSPFAFSQNAPSSGDGSGPGLDGLFGSLKKAAGEVGDAVGRGIDRKLSNDATPGSGQPVDGGNVPGAPASSGKVYEPLSPANGNFKDLFKGTSRPHRINSSDTGWPRAALTYLKWGANLPCWEVKADIWKSPKNHTVETFRICDVPYPLTDATGQVGWVNSNAHFSISNYLDHQTSQRGYWTDTGETRTSGPTPPAQSFNININIDRNELWRGNNKTTLSNRLNAINSRIALVSGFILPQESRSAPQTLNDVRLWFHKFDLSGKHD